MIDLDPQKMLAEAMKKAKECFHAGDLDYGKEILQQVLRCCPEHQAAIQLLGVFHHNCRDYRNAIPLFELAIALDPDNPDNYNNLALCQGSLGDVDAAIASLGSAISIDPNARFLGNLALQYRLKGWHQEGVNLVRRALEMTPKDMQLWSNLGGLYGEMHRLGDAEGCYRQALLLDPEMASAHVDLAYTLHLQGRYREAWTEYEHRFDFFDNLVCYKIMYDQGKRWREPGGDQSGKTILVYCEQGLGDAINFARYIPVLKSRHACRVVLHCWDSCRTLFEGSELGVDEYFTTPIVQATPGDIPHHDLHASIMSLPYLLDLDGVVGSPYLRAPERANLGHPDSVRVGICWAGSPQHPNDRIRSCHLRRFRGIHDLPGVRLFNLQQDIRPRRYPPGEAVFDFGEGADFALVDLSEFMTDFARTASLLADLDLVITVDTAVMHLAGAIGIPTIGLLAFTPDWRWGVEGRDTPWYDSLTFLRQGTPGDWDGVFEELRTKVLTFLERRPHAEIHER